MAAAEAPHVVEVEDVEEEAIHMCILKKCQWSNMHALPREQNRAVCGMVGLPLKEDKDNSGNEQIRLHPYRIFVWHFREKDDTGSVKGKGSHG
ncbi:hypothetical protein D1007_33399 [Hordeum vulgare]|nr:hypothetical protein D1007_33399 [Hordeum vulgare]